MASTVSVSTHYVSSPPAACIQIPSSRDFLVGTYTLDTSTNLRSGSLLLYSHDSGSTTTNLKHEETLNLEPKHGSILDIKGSYIATSTGFILQYTTTPHLLITSEHKLFEDSALVLSLALHPTDQGILAATLSTSEIAVLRDFVVVATISDAHSSLEVWTSSFGPAGDVLYSGGDDSCFVEYSFSNEDGLVQLSRDRKTHCAGVTAILPLKGTVLTGSYDGYLRIFNPATRKFVGEGIDLGGGVWRLEILNEEKGLVLASCMHAGCRVVQVNGGEVIVQAKMEEHESMNYASAALQVEGEDQWIVVSTSFYDKRLCFWEFKL